MSLDEELSEEPFYNIRYWQELKACIAENIYGSTIVLKPISIKELTDIYFNDNKMFIYKRRDEQ